MMLPTGPSGPSMSLPPMGASAPPPSMAMPPPSGATPLEQLNSHYDKLSEADSKLKIARSGIDSLVKMGDTVSVEDVVKVAGKLVAKGLDPGAMASLLSEMPEKTELLVAWLEQHDKQLASREADLERVQLVVRHQLGVEGLRTLMQGGDQGQELSAGPPGPPSMSLPQQGAPTAPGGPQNA